MHERDYYLDDVMYRNISHIERFQGLMLIKKQSVADHSWHTTLIGIQFCNELLEEAPRGDWVDDQLAQYYGSNADLFRYDVVSMCAQHDCPEAVSGDVIHPTKAIIAPYVDIDALAEQELKQVGFLKHTTSNPLVDAVVTFCDLTEAALYLLDEISLGNTTGGVIDTCQKIIAKVKEHKLAATTTGKQLTAKLERHFYGNFGPGWGNRLTL